MESLLGVDPPPRDWNFSHKRANLAAGFKIMAHQIKALSDENKFWSYISNNDVKIILNIRDNILLQYVSDLIVQKTHQPACWDGKVERTRVEVPISTLKSELVNIREERRWLYQRVINFDHRILKYEEFKDNIGKVELLLPWLIGSNCHLKSRLSKQNPNNLQDRVTNYRAVIDEVRRIGMDYLIDWR